jgi:uncharacterized protein (TIGR00159 family)
MDRIYTALQLGNVDAHAVVDILLLAFVLYHLLRLIRGTRSVTIMIALGVLVLLHLLSGPAVFDLNAFHTVLGALLTYIPLAAIILFQNQIRRFLSNLGRNPLSAWPRRREDTLAEEVSLAAASLASKRLGALIVIERDMGLRSFWETGIALDAETSYDLLMNIFTFRSPLHDGAAIIAEGRIKAASCYLPLTMNATLSRKYGTRHRAAFGITEESDAIAVVVSEERGVISVVDRGEILEDLTAKELQRVLVRALTGGGEPGPAPTGSHVMSEATDA